MSKKKSPTSRSLNALKRMGYHPEVVEKWIPQARRRKDLWGFVDILAIHLGDAHLLGVQCTTLSNAPARVRKIRESDLWPVVKRGPVTVRVWGWRKRKDGWKAKVYIP